MSGREEEPSKKTPPPATWRALEAVPVFLLWLFTVAVADAVVFGSTRSCGIRTILPTLLGELAFVALVVLWIRLVNKGDVAALGLPRQPALDVAAGVLTGAAVLVLGGLTLALTRAAVSAIIGHPPPQAEQLPACIRGVSLAWVSPVVVLAAPLGEETFFRGFLYKGLRRRFSVWPAALISAFLFGAIHYQGVKYLLLVPGLFVVGLGLALVYERRQSLLASMTAHATFNLIGIISIALSRR